MLPTSQIEVRRKVPRAVREPQMLDAAVRVFAQRGYHGASMAEIAEGAGVTKPMVYAYFGSKDQLYLACIEQAGRELRNALEVAGEERQLERRLWRRLLAYFEFVGQRRDEWRVLNREATSTGGPFSEQVARARGEAIRLVAQQLEEAVQAGGGTAPASELEPLAHALVGAGESLADWWVDHPDEPVEAMALRLMNLVWLGLGDLLEGRLWAPA
jgi:AcrR family transcriptional regulator